MPRICNLFTDKSLEEFLNQKHHKDIFCDHHAGCFLIGKVGIEFKTQFFKK
ncbi:hypothetical protein D3C86_1902180 [compost metagenome]